MQALLGRELIARAMLVESPNLIYNGPKERGQLTPDEAIRLMVKKQFRKASIENLEIDNAKLVVNNHKGKTESAADGIKLYCNKFDLNNPARSDGLGLLSAWYNVQLRSARAYLGDGVHELVAVNLKYFSDKNGFFANEIAINGKQLPADSGVTLPTVIRQALFTNVGIEGLHLEMWQKQQMIDIDYVECKGRGHLDLFLGALPQGQGVAGLRLGELNIDSVDLRVESRPSGQNSNTVNIKGLVFQACDLTWDTTMAPGRFNLYSILALGNEVEGVFGNEGYGVKAQRFAINSGFELAQVSGLDIRPLSDTYSGKNSVWFSTPSTKISGVDLPRFFATRAVEADNFYSSKPRFVGHIHKADNNGLVSFLTSPFMKIKEYLGPIAIQAVRIHEGEVHYTSYEGQRQVEYTVSDLMAYMEDLHIDTNTTLTESNMFFAKKSEIGFKNFEQRANDTSMVLSLGGVMLLPHKNSVVLEQLELKNRRQEGSLAHFSIKSDRVHLLEFNFLQFLLKKSLLLQKADFQGASLTVGMRKKTADNKQFFEETIPRALTRAFNRIYADTVHLGSAGINVYYRNKATRQVDRQRIDGWDILFQVFEVNRDLGKLNFLYSRAISAKLSNFSYDLPDGLNQVYLGTLNADVNRGRIYLDSVKLVPKYSKVAYAAKYGKKIDRIEVTNTNSSIEGFNFKEWLYYGRYVAEEVWLRKTDISVYTDKTYPPDKAKLRDMPQEILGQVPIELYIGKTSLVDWNIQYEEKADNLMEPGSIEFHHLTGTISAVTNIPNQMDTTVVKLLFTTGLMENGRVNLGIDIPLSDPECTFTFWGNMNGMDMREINPLLMSLVQIRITKGETYGMNFKGQANKYFASGTVDLRYSDLNVEVLDEKGETSFKEWAMKVLANNFVIKNSNRLFPRTGKIDYVRNEYLSIFNYGAKALLTGIKESIGLRNREGIDSVVKPE
jgi:hypothetical protein